MLSLKDRYKLNAGRGWANGWLKARRKQRKSVQELYEHLKEIQIDREVVYDYTPLSEHFLSGVAEAAVARTLNDEIVSLRLKIRNTTDKTKAGKKRINTLYRSMLGLCRVVETEEHIHNLKNCGSSLGLIKVMEKQLVIYESEVL